MCVGAIPYTPSETTEKKPREPIPTNAFNFKHFVQNCLYILKANNGNEDGIENDEIWQTGEGIDNNETPKNGRTK
jgi:hypothetical protein